MCKQVKSCLYKILPTKYSLLKGIYIYRQNLALNNLQRLIRHKTQPTNQPNQLPTNQPSTNQPTNN